MGNKGKTADVSVNFGSLDVTQPVALIPRGEEFLAVLRANLTPARLDHSLEVMAVMDRLAGVYGLEREKALTAGLLHDVVKDFSDERLLALAEEGGLPLDDPIDRHPLYLHGPVGAVYLRRELGIEDREILDAIYTHGFAVNGSDFHAPFSWCLRFADILAPSRSWKDFHAQLGPLVYAGRLEDGALMVLEWVVQLYTRLGNPIHARIPAMIAEMRKGHL
jgi:predicted HD superfamily hydrolase involved in NAD metabolism